MNDIKNFNSQEPESNLLDQKVKSYEKPVLVFYGDVRDITLGPTFGSEESGCSAIYRSGAGGCP